MEFRFLIAFLLLSIGLSAQVYQTNNAPYQFTRGTKNDTILVIPRGADTPTIGNTKFGAPTIGAIFYKTADSTFWLRSATRWNKVSVDVSGKLNISDTGAMLSPYLRFAYRVPGQDSIRFVRGDGSEFAVKDSTGGSGDCAILSVNYKGGNNVDTIYTVDCNNDTLDVYYAINKQGLISGGVVTYSGFDLVYYVSAAVYRIGNTFYASNDTTITLPPLADADSSRSDAFVVNTAGQATSVQGVESGNPLTPQVDPASQIYLTHVTLTPSNPVAGLDTVIVYDEAAVSEWPNRSASGVTVNFLSTNNPYRGTYTTETQGINNNDVIGYGTNTLYNRESYSALSLFIRLKSAMPSNNNIYVSFYNGASQVSNELVFALTKSNTTSYQGLSFSMSAFSWTNAFFDSIRIRYSGSAGITGLYLDFIYLQSGMDVAVPGNFLTDIRRNGNDVQQQLNGIYTTRFSLSDKLAISDTAGMLAPYIRNAYRIPGQDSIRFVRGNGTDFAVKDSTVAGGGTICGNYRFSTTTTASDPGSGYLRLNNATYSSVTNIYIDKISNNSTDVTAIVTAIRSGDVVYIQDQDDATKFIRTTASGTATDNTGWWTIPVTYVSSNGTLFSNNANLSICILFGSGGSTIDTTSLSNRIDLKADKATTITISGGTGIDVTGGTQDLSADRTWTVDSDTLLMSTRAWRQKGIDSLAALIGAGVTGSGTATRVAFWNGATSLSSNANLYWDNSNNRLGIGTSSPSHPLHVTHSLAGTAITSYIKNSDSTGRALYYMENDSLQYGAFGVYGADFSSVDLRNDVGFASSKDMHIITGDNVSARGGGKIVARTGITGNVYLWESDTLGIYFKSRLNTNVGGILYSNQTNTPNIIFASVANNIADPVAGLSAGSVQTYNLSTTNNYGLGLGALRSSKIDLWFQTGATNGGGYRFYEGTNERFTIFTGGNVGINSGSTNVASALLHLNSTSKGFLPPRMTTAQRDAISAPATGLMIFCTDCTATDGSTGVTQTYSSTAWRNHY